MEIKTIEELLNEIVDFYLKNLKHLASKKHISNKNDFLRQFSIAKILFEETKNFNIKFTENSYGNEIVNEHKGKIEDFFISNCEKFNTTQIASQVINDFLLLAKKRYTIQAIINKEALLEYAMDCTLTTIEELSMKKNISKVIKLEIELQITMATKIVNFAIQNNININKTEMREITNSFNGDISKWSENLISKNRVKTSSKLSQ